MTEARGVLERVLADDAVEVFLFAHPKDIIESHQLDQLHQRACQIVRELSQDYIWHREPLILQKRFHPNNVSLSENEDDKNPSHIYGMCCYGDNVEDEWFIVYIIKEITRRIPELIARITDNDGEFLLIEAANSLPSWANPDVCANRVFFIKGQLHIIPPIDEEENEEISITEALSQIFVNTGNYVASQEIHNDINERIGGYPEKIKELLHQTTVYTPVGVAALLKEDPGLISSAINAFCVKDQIDMKVIRAMRYFPPENRVNTSVKFTKCLYAMLIHNNFTPDRRTGWNLPPSNSPQYKSHSLGVKLACGFEILVAQAKPDKPFESNKAWSTYLESLKKRNYFQGLLEHSQQYNVFLENAKEYFLTNIDYAKFTPVVGKRILDLLGKINIDEKSFRKRESLLPDDDDDKWLYVDPKDLENLLQKRYGKKDFVTVDDSTNSEQFSKKIANFLEQTSGIDGVEFPNSSSDLPIRPKRGIKSKKKSSNISTNSDSSRSPSLTRKYKMDFDPDQFVGAVNNILDLVIPDDNWNLESESDLSNYDSDDDLSAKIFDKSPSDKQDNLTLKTYMKEMDEQLAKTTIGKSFENKQAGRSNVDINTNTLKNMMQGYKEEAGGSGPSGNILEPLGYTKVNCVNSIDEEVD